MTTYSPDESLPPGAWVPNGRGIVTYWVAPAPEVPAPVSCNTERGYQWHRHNEPDNWPLPADDPCGCRAAHSAWNSFMTRRRAERECAA